MSTMKYNTLADMQQKSVASFGNRPLFGTKEGGAWRWMTFAEFGRRVDDFRGGLADQGVGKGDAVALISSNRSEWAIAAYATYGLGALLVPMYEHQLEKDWDFILKDCGAKLLVASTRDRFPVVRLAAVETIAEAIRLVGGAPSTKRVCALLNDPSPAVRAAVLGVLPRTRAPCPVRQVVALLEAAVHWVVSCRNPFLLSWLRAFRSSGIPVRLC